MSTPPTMTVDAFTAACPHYIAAKAKLVRTGDIVPTVDERPWAGYVKVFFGGLLFFSALILGAMFVFNL